MFRDQPQPDTWRFVLIGRFRVALAALIVGFAALAAVAAQDGGSSSAEVRITALRHSDGRTEFALQQRATGAAWSDRLLPGGRYLPARTRVGQWLNSTLVTLSEPVAGTVVRISARRLDDGRVEFALQRLGAGGRWTERQLPRSRYVPAQPGVGRWLSSSALAISVQRGGTENAMRADDNGASSAPPECRLPDHAGRVSAATFQVWHEEAAGSAFYIGRDEWITNHHVVGAEREVRLVRGDYEIIARVIGTLPDYDLALLRAPAPAAAAALAFAERQPPQGARVSAVGFPTGVSGTPSLTTGAVSKHAPFAQFAAFVGDGQMLQVDTALNPGSSGGPMVDDCGLVVGVVTHKLFTSADGRALEGIGYGVAGETVAAQLPALRTSGRGEDAAVGSDRARFGVAASGAFASGIWSHFWGGEEYGWTTLVSVEGSTTDFYYSTGRLDLGCVHGEETMAVFVKAQRSGRRSDEEATLNRSVDTVGAFYDAAVRVGEPFWWSTSAQNAGEVGRLAAEFIRTASRSDASTVAFLLPRWGEDIVARFDLADVFETPVQHLLEQCLE